MKYLNKYKLLPDFQYGFRKETSTVDLVVKIITTITEDLNNNEQALGVFLAAF